MPKYRTSTMKQNIINQLCLKLQNDIFYFCAIQTKNQITKQRQSVFWFAVRRLKSRSLNSFRYSRIFFITDKGRGDKPDHRARNSLRDFCNSSFTALLHVAENVVRLKHTSCFPEQHCSRFNPILDEISKQAECIDVYCCVLYFRRTRISLWLQLSGPQPAGCVYRLTSLSHPSLASWSMASGERLAASLLSRSR